MKYFYDVFKYGDGNEVINVVPSNIQSTSMYTGDYIEYFVAFAEGGKEMFSVHITEGFDAKVINIRGEWRSKGGVYPLSWTDSGMMVAAGCKIFDLSIV